MNNHPNDPAPRDLPADAALTQIVLILDRDGVFPPRLIMHDYRCNAPKEHAYMLCGERIDMSSKKKIAELMLFSKAIYSLKKVSIGPLDVLSKTDRLDSPVFFDQTVPIEHRDMLKSGVIFYSRVCLTSRKDQVLARIVRQYRDHWNGEMNQLSRRGSQLIDLAAQHAVPVAPAISNEEDALRTVQREAARLPGDAGSSAAREAVSILADHIAANADVGVLDGIDATVSRLLQLRAVVQAELASGMVEPSKGAALSGDLDRGSEPGQALDAPGL